MENDILFSIVGALGNVYVVDKKYCLQIQTKHLQ